MQIGFIIHGVSDLHLISLRYRNPADYSIPCGHLFEFISCPNYFGECLEWIGFAIAARSFPSIAFAFFTVCNLAPRAMSHHKWYHEKFREKYPNNRKALIPYVCNHSRELIVDMNRKM
uniref:S5A_REDUCTASE domain-containing protein n=1 Tax=Caenorhabditis tropicalis TaxID=1561998 RepID=A0A1I7UYD1_9PELO